MKYIYLNRILFITKSLLWSVAIYTAFVIAMDWEEIAHRISKQPDIVLINNVPIPVSGQASANCNAISTILHLINTKL